MGMHDEKIDILFFYCLQYLLDGRPFPDQSPDAEAISLLHLDNFIQVFFCFRKELEVIIFTISLHDLLFLNTAGRLHTG